MVIALNRKQNDFLIVFKAVFKKIWGRTKNVRLSRKAKWLSLADAAQPSRPALSSLPSVDDAA
jgi:hypothetical protein